MVSSFGRYCSSETIVETFRLPYNSQFADSERSLSQLISRFMQPNSIMSSMGKMGKIYAALRNYIIV